jgi:ankyrin repeat protein
VSIKTRPLFNLPIKQYFQPCLCPTYLPNELLLDIATQLNNAEMNALARTNSRVYRLLNGRLYKRDMANPQSKSFPWGVKNGVETTVRQAIAAAQPLNPIPECYNSALQVAADKGHVPIVKMLLEVDGINPNPKL